MHFLEFERHQLLFCIEHSKVSDDAVTFRMLDTKQRHVEHGVRVPDETQSDPQVRGVFDDWSMCLGNLTLFLIEQFMICHSAIITKESRVGLHRSFQDCQELKKKLQELFLLVDRLVLQNEVLKFLM